MGKGKAQKYKEVEVVEEVDEFEDEEEEEETPSEVETKFVNGLPPVQRRRVYALIGLQKKTSELNREFVKELSQLEMKYDKLNKPHYERRKALVSGEEDPTLEECVAGTDGGKEEEVQADLDKAKAEASFKEGVPNFWRLALENIEEIEQSITEKDAEALLHLKDISSESFEVNDSESEEPTSGFKLSFEFDTNPFFKNSVLTKTYYLVAEGRELLMDKAEGTEIDWYPKKNLTVEEKQKKQKRGKETRVVVRQEPCDSFFKFFSPPTITGEEDSDAEEELEGEVEADYEIGSMFRDSVIPKAVAWYTGEAIPQLELPPGMMSQMGGLNFGQDDDDDDDDEDDEGADGKKKEECPQQ